MKKTAFFALFCCCVMPVFAAEGDSGLSGSSELELQAASSPAAKFAFTRRYSVPFLRGNSPLTQTNGFDYSLRAEVSPISLNGLVEAVWTPIAFLQVAVGGMAGSGWNINLFGGDTYGIGLNYADTDGKAAHSGGAFDGFLLKAQAGAALQMDLAALFPGDWNHVIIRTYHELNQKNYTRAKAGESWYFENDDGENCNGLNYYGNLVLGYQMPIFLNMVALLTEANLYLYDTPGRAAWGDDRIRWTFSGVFNFTITRNFSAALLTQFITMRNFLESNWEELYYRNRRIDNSDPLRLEFYRAAVILIYKL